MTGTPGEALDDHEAEAMLREAWLTHHRSRGGGNWHTFLAALNDQDVVLVWDGPAEAASKRPGGWVDGIGWVALRCQLATGDHYKDDQQDHHPSEVRGTGWKRRPVIVTRWADGTTPKAGDQ